MYSYSLSLPPYCQSSNIYLIIWTVICLIKNKVQIFKSTFYKLKTNNNTFSEVFEAKDPSQNGTIKMSLSEVSIFCDMIAPKLQFYFFQWLKASLTC